MAIVFTALILCALYKVGASLNVYMEDISIEEINPEYFDVDNTDGTIVDNMINTKFTIIKTLPEETEFHFKLSGLSMGKYTLPTGVDIWLPMCEVPNEPILMQPFFSGLGILDRGCPPPAGSYAKDGFALPMDNLPDDFPNNKYQVILESHFNDEILFNVELYVDVQT